MMFELVIVMKDRPGTHWYYQPQSEASHFFKVCFSNETVKFYSRLLRVSHLKHRVSDHCQKRFQRYSAV